MRLHELKPNTPRQGKKRVGRGGKRGTYSGRGLKGQRAHSSGRIRPEMRDIIKKIPKKRGHGKNRSRGVSDLRLSALPVNLGALERAFSAGDVVTPQTLRAKGLVGGRGRRPVKILGTGILTKQLSVSGIPISKSAKEAIERVGGTIR